MSDFKVLVLDLDGTTLMWGDRIHEADVAARMQRSIHLVDGRVDPSVP